MITPTTKTDVKALRKNLKILTLTVYLIALWLFIITTLTYIKVSNIITFGVQCTEQMK